MSGTVISNNTSTKINRAISGSSTVTANGHAIVTYSAGGDAHSGAGYNGSFGSPQGSVIVRHFGPGQSIPATFTTTIFAFVPGGAGTPNSATTVTWTLLSGVEYINSP